MTAYPALPAAPDETPYVTEFMRAVLSAARGGEPLGWAEVNTLAARHLRPEAGGALADTSRLGHALVAEMARQGLVEAELAYAANGGVLATGVSEARVVAYALAA